MDPANRYGVSPDALIRQVGEEVIILELSEGQYYGLDELGTRILDLLQKDATIADICDQLLEEYDVDRATLNKDVGKLIDDLVACGVLELKRVP